MVNFDLCYAGLCFGVVAALVGWDVGGFVAAVKFYFFFGVEIPLFFHRNGDLFNSCVVGCFEL